MAKDKKAKKSYTEHSMWKEKTEADFDLLFRKPGENEVGSFSSPDEKLALYFKEKKQKSTENLIQIAIAAHELWKANKTQRTGKNELSETFTKWYEKFNMDKIFGSKPTFNKYHKAGEFLQECYTKGDNEIRRGFAVNIAQLPLNIYTLYLIQSMTDEELKLALEDTYFKDPKNKFAITKKKSRKPQPIIHPQATETEIKRWLEKFRNPPLPKTDPRAVYLMTLKVDKSIFYFNHTSGEHEGATSIADVEQIDRKVKEALTGLEAKVHIESAIDDVKDKVDKRQEQAAEAAKKKSGKK